MRLVENHFAKNTVKTEIQAYVLRLEYAVFS